MTQQTVATPSLRYKELAAKRKLPRTLIGGTEAMRDAGKTYLPKHPAESESSYRVRKAGTTLYNAFKKTVSSQVGKVFSDPIKLGDDVPQQILNIRDNIDGAGRGLTEFSMDVFDAAMIDGISFMLVDYPVTSEAATAADEQLLGTRPYAIHITADNLISWTHDNISGVQTLTEIRIKEARVEKVEEWGETQVDSIRVIRPGSFEVHTKTNKEYVKTDEGITKTDFIPIVPVYTNRVGFFEGEPTLMPLAELNLDHWVSTSEQRKALTFARFAMLVVTGVQAKQEIVVGADKVLKLTDPQGKASYVETSGAALEAGRKDIEDIETRMESTGMSLRVENAGNVAATTAAIGSEDSNAALVSVAESLGKSLSTMLDYMAIMYGITSGGGTAEVNTDFGGKEPTGTVTELNQARSLNNLSQELYTNEMVRRGVFDEETDIQEELKRLSAIAID